ncbi:MAG: DUF2852 domain-containing protein [Rhodobacteraceae bacterium]|nr:MAG: DUF2852 domain-containing protein [Paracoccaceae bacterium]
MTTATANASWLARAEAWLDGFGKGGWIAAMVLGFILFWPIGLAFLAYMIWGKKMFGTSCRKKIAHAGIATSSSGNSAFDAYKADTLRRLEDEQAAFDAFLERLREAKDKAEFDQFMDENRRKRAAEAPVAADQD